MKVPRLSIALKLYAIFALMAIAALGLEMAAHAHGPVWISAIAGVVVFSAVGLAVGGARSITRPLAELAAMTDLIACG